MLGLLFHPEDGGSMLLQKFSEDLSNYGVSHPKRQYSFYVTLIISFNIRLYICSVLPPSRFCPTPIPPSTRKIKAVIN
jgi:hypothetical protein